MKVPILTFALCILLIGCNTKNEFKLVIDNNHSGDDTLYVKELITGRTIATVPLNAINTEHKFNINETTLGELKTKNSDNAYLTILSPGTRKTISVDSVSIRTSTSVSDSLVNYLWKSTNQMISSHYRRIFSEDGSEKVLFLFDSLVEARGEQLNKLKFQLTGDEYGLLEYQNKARAYSFLMYYGRIIKQYPAKSEFFNFISEIDNENTYSKSLPNNLLYKYEIQVLRETDSIQSISSFLKFIKKNTKEKDLQDYLKAIYIRDVIESPSYWRMHKHLFTTTTIKEALAEEQNNKYLFLIKEASESFYTSQKGEKGFDFTAYKTDGAKIKLSDLREKLVVIDTWATWCGPCIAHRPAMLEMAKRLKDNSEIVVLMISVDTSIERWKKYVSKTNPDNYGIELNIPDGMNSEFGDKYLIKAIPKYILIDKNGIILNSNLPEPSTKMEQLILDTLIENEAK